MKNKFLITFVMLLTIWSCTPDIEDFQDTQNNTNTTTTSTNTNTTTQTNSMADLQIPSNFNFETSRKINLDLDVKSLKDAPLDNVKVSFYTDHPDFEGEYISSGYTNSTGRLSTELQVPTYLDSLFVQVHSIGFANQKKELISPYMNLDFGGTPDGRSMNNTGRTTSNPIHISGNYYYMGTFNTGSYKGLPHYLEPEGDDLSQQFLDDVDASLPEDKPVPQNNPQYLTTGNELDVIVNDTSDVWVTFVAEGAGYRNALGYYVFDTDNPPATASEIDSVFIVLPNTSFAYSGGELYSGDKVKLGTFPPGKTISWVLFQNAWRGTGVDVNATKYYSRIDFNTSESNPNMRQHTVQLADLDNQLLLNGFEDLPRSTGQSDEDFNDLIFYVSANPWEAIETGGIPEVQEATDSDGDGVLDENDEFPNDPLRAARNTYKGSLGFEDLWPAQGDYDFNDLVIDYEIDHIVNSENMLVDIEADWTIRAVFATFSNGFGVDFKNITSNDIASITGLNHSENIISLNGNGTESNQDNATVIFFDNVFNIVQGSPFPHTSPTSTLSATITFSSPMSQNTVGYPPYNPFIFVDGDRSKEIHLPGHQPTDLANMALFGTGGDATDFTGNYFYKTDNGLPWAINLTESFDFPNSGISINQAYHHFATWATSGGMVNKDWYKDEPGYRDTSKIYD